MSHAITDGGDASIRRISHDGFIKWLEDLFTATAVGSTVSAYEEQYKSILPPCLTPGKEVTESYREGEKSQEDRLIDW